MTDDADGLCCAADWCRHADDDSPRGALAKIGHHSHFEGYAEFRAVGRDRGRTDIESLIEVTLFIENVHSR